MSTNRQVQDAQAPAAMKPLPDESNRPAIEEMLLHSYEFALAMGLAQAGISGRRTRSKRTKTQRTVSLARGER